MIYSKNIVTNGSQPTSVSPWATSNVGIARHLNQNAFQLYGTGYMKQDLTLVDFILQPKDIKISIQYDLTHVPDVQDLVNRVHMKLILRYQQGGDDVFTYPLFDDVSNNWFDKTVFAATRENAVLVSANIELYSYQLPSPVLVTNIAVYPGVDELGEHELNTHPHQLPLAIEVGQFGIKATKGQDIKFWLKDTGDAIFAGTLEAANGTFAGELKAASGTFRGELTAATGTFTGELKAATGTFKGEVRGGSITSDTDINVTRDINVGRNIYLERGTSRKKRIVFSDSDSDAYINYDNGDLTLFAYDKIEVTADEIDIDATVGKLNLAGDDVDISSSDSGDVSCYGNWDFRSARNLRGLWTEKTGEHNHGIPNGTPLLMAGSSPGSFKVVTWVESGKHEHEIILGN